MQAFEKRSSNAKFENSRTENMNIDKLKQSFLEHMNKPFELEKICIFIKRQKSKKVPVTTDPMGEVVNSSWRIFPFCVRWPAQMCFYTLYIQINVNNIITLTLTFIIVNFINVTFHLIFFSVFSPTCFYKAALYGQKPICLMERGT